MRLRHSVSLPFPAYVFHQVMHVDYEGVHQAAENRHDHHTETVREKREQVTNATGSLTSLTHFLSLGGGSRLLGSESLRRASIRTC
jgi:hypothetical protein